LLASAGDDDLFASRGPFDQFGQAVLGFEDAHSGHGDVPGLTIAQSLII
jgi:hypothetical protein